jgi:hypothetical protein
MSILLYRITLTVGRLVGLTCLANSNGVVMICCLPRCWCEILDIGAVGHQGGLCGQLFGERRGGVDVCFSLVMGIARNGCRDPGFGGASTKAASRVMEA